MLKCDEHPDKKSSKLIFTVVIDDAGIEGIENTLAELAEEEPNGNNISSIKQALNRLLNRVDANHASYFFDEISVLTAEDFSNLLIIEKTLV